jgi:hypothetical protein
MNYLSLDSEEWFLLTGDIQGNPPYELSGIAGIYDLAKAGLVGDALESLRNESATEGLYGACRGGHKDLALLMIQKLDHPIMRSIWDTGLEEACIGGHEDLALLMIEKGAYETYAGLGLACEHGHLSVSQLMFDFTLPYDQEWGLIGACKGKHLEIIKWICQEMLTMDYDQEYLVKVSGSKDKEVIDLIMSQTKL